MTIRVIFGLGWSLVTGLAGGWLTMAPWTLSGQASGDWTTVTRSEFGAGLGLLLLAVIGIALVVGQTVGALRGAGLIAPGRAARVRGQAAGVTASPEMEKALIALAQALAQDLDSQRSPVPATRQSGPEHPSVPSWREQS